MAIKKILIVDDSPTEVFHLREILSKQGYEIVVAESGEDGIIKSKLAKPDLILMDVVMPGMNGFQATRAISKDDDTRNIPIIMCTTKGQETDRVWGMRQGAKDYIVKPVNQDELLKKITALG